MKFLVLAQVPPPLHGQSLMVQTLVDGLPTHGIPVHHVNLGLSRDSADIGRWRWGKLFAVLGACWRTVAARFRHGCNTLYYVPAPGKRGALYRDWTVMLFCRPFFKHLVLHWHATGLGEWLTTHGSAPERWLSRWLLGRASLSVVLSDQLRGDAEFLSARKIVTVPNGIADPGDPAGPRPSTAPFQVFFLGLCSHEKGLFAAVEAVLAANRATKTPDRAPPFTLVAAGPFADPDTAEKFHALCAIHPDELRHAGSVAGVEKSRLFSTSHCFCLPTRYPAEGQPLVLLEAMAHDLPVVATRWRAIPDTLPPDAILVEPGDTAAITQALLQLRRSPPPAGISRRHFLAYYTSSQHLSALSAALGSLDRS
jgi:glycosyltransferase involved in cell wall biosynthesis